MAGKRPTNRWTFDTTDQVVAWMENEYLSELTLEGLDPAPAEGVTPPAVRFSWALHGTGAGRVVPYAVVAEGVRAWMLDGPRDDAAISVTANEGPGVRLVFGVPGTLTLECDRLTVTRGRTRKKPPPPRPHTDYAYFVVTSERAATVGDVLAALGAPEGVEVVSPLPVDPDARIVPRGPGTFELREGGRAWIKVYNMTAANVAGFSLSVSRAGATDAEWRRAQDLPRLLGPARVASAWEFFGTDAEWSAMLARADARSPAP